VNFHGVRNAEHARYWIFLYPDMAKRTCFLMPG